MALALNMAHAITLFPALEKPYPAWVIRDGGGVSIRSTRFAASRGGRSGAGGRAGDAKEDGGEEEADRRGPHEAEVVFAQIGGPASRAEVAAAEDICGAVRRLIGFLRTVVRGLFRKGGREREREKMSEMWSGKGRRPGLRHERHGQTLEEQRNRTECAGEKTSDPAAEGQYSQKQRADGEEESNQDKGKHEAR